MIKSPDKSHRWIARSNHRATKERSAGQIRTIDKKNTQELVEEQLADEQD